MSKVVNVRGLYDVQSPSNEALLPSFVNTSLAEAVHEKIAK